jgi:hypothetical protein
MFSYSVTVGASICSAVDSAEVGSNSHATMSSPVTWKVRLALR